MSRCAPAAPAAPAALLSASPSVVVAPRDPRGAALTGFVAEVGAAARRGDVTVDEGACAGWSPGQRLVLERLRAVVVRRGRRWVSV